MLENVIKVEVYIASATAYLLNYGSMDAANLRNATRIQATSGEGSNLSQGADVVTVAEEGQWVPQSRSLAKWDSSLNPASLCMCWQGFAATRPGQLYRGYAAWWPGLASKGRCKGVGMLLRCVAQGGKDNWECFMACVVELLMEIDVLPGCARNKVNVSRSIGRVSAKAELDVSDDDH